MAEHTINVDRPHSQHARPLDLLVDRCVQKSVLRSRAVPRESCAGHKQDFGSARGRADSTRYSDARQAGSHRGGAWQAHSPGACDASPPPPRGSARRPGPGRSGAGAACWRSATSPGCVGGALTRPGGGAIHGRAGNGGSSHLCARSASGTSMGKGDGSQASPSRWTLATFASRDRASVPRDAASWSSNAR